MDKKVGQWASGSDICWRFLCCGILQERYLAKSERITVPNEAPCGRCGTYWAMPSLRPPERVCRNADYGKIAGGRVEDSPRGAAVSEIDAVSAYPASIKKPDVIDDMLSNTIAALAGHDNVGEWRKSGRWQISCDCEKGNGSSQLAAEPESLYTCCIYCRKSFRRPPSGVGQWDNPPNEITWGYGCSCGAIQNGFGSRFGPVKCTGCGKPQHRPVAKLIVGPSLTDKSEVRSGHAVDGQPFPDTFSDVQRLIRGECVELCAMLLKKNAAYGNSALDPLRLFSKASPQEQLRVRIDDKLSRLRSAQVDTEDMVSDLLGYLILLRVSGKLQANK